MQPTAFPVNPYALIAIDGTFASGKGTLAKRLATYYGFAHLDTGKLYRALAWHLLNKNYNGDIQDADFSHTACALARELTIADTRLPLLQNPEIAIVASKIAVNPEIRQALYALQRDFACNPNQFASKSTDNTFYKGAILDGRDIGTVICPEAKIKFYVDAKPKIRAQRRFDELRATHANLHYEDVYAQLCARDKRDSQRMHAPLKIAQNAHLLDTSNLCIDAVLNSAIRVIDAIIALG